MRRCHRPYQHATDKVLLIHRVGSRRASLAQHLMPSCCAKRVMDKQDAQLLRQSGERQQDTRLCIQRQTWRDGCHIRVMAATRYSVSESSRIHGGCLPCRFNQYVLSMHQSESTLGWLISLWVCVCVFVSACVCVYVCTYAAVCIRVDVCPLVCSPVCMYMSVHKRWYQPSCY